MAMFYVHCYNLGGFILQLLLLACLIRAHRTRRSQIDNRAIIITASQCNAHSFNHITHSLPHSCPTNLWSKLASAPAQPSADIGQQIAGDDASPNGVNDHALLPATTARALAAAAKVTTSTTTGTVNTVWSAALPDEINSDPAATPFMSFEDWKEMMLRRAGQDPQELRQRRIKEQKAGNRAPQEFGDTSLGEEGEISLSFDDDHVRHDRNEGGSKTHVDAENGGAGGGGNPSSALGFQDGKTLHRSKDAGKTCKERFSYSSFDAGATILKTGQGAKNAKAILVEHKDSYMLLECAAQNKYVIVELSDDILIDTIVIANFEFFSSMVRHFQVSVSDRYPVKMEKWRNLGLFEARNSRDIQPFLVENPQIWAKYVRLEFLTHYGNEYYCPVSLLRIHGSRMLDSWKDSETGHDEALADEASAPSPSPYSPSVMTTSLPKLQVAGGGLPFLEAPFQLWTDRFAQDVFYQLNATCTIPSILADEVWVSGNNVALPEDIIKSPQQASLPSNTWESAPKSAPPTPPRSDSDQSRDNFSLLPRRESSMASRNTHLETPTEPSDAASGGPAASDANSSTLATKVTSSVAVGGKKIGWTTSATSASPTVQESFFNAITKRLQQVESNLTLSLKYVEDQSRHIQDVLQKAEHKQITKLAAILADLNQTVLAELHRVQDQYDQIWQSAILVLESQRDQSERDIVALSSRLNVLADEVVFQKRMAIVQAVLLLSCLFLVISSRGVSISYLAPLQEQNDINSYATVSPSSDTPLSYGVESTVVDQDNNCPVGDRYYAGESVSDQTTPGAMDSPGSRDADDRDDASSTPLSSENDTDNHARTSVENVQADSTRRSAISHQNNSRNPLPSLPEHFLSVENS